MPLMNEESVRKESVLSAAKAMLSAARTAPKGKGKDNLVAALAERDVVEKISAHLEMMVERDGLDDYFLRDAVNIRSAQAMLLLGTKIQPMNVEPCGMCGFTDCNEKEQYPNHPCVFNTGDLGIAVGSVVSMAADYRIDNRIMYTVGQAVKEMGLLGDDVPIIYAIPLSVSRKDPFFDRKKKH